MSTFDAKKPSATEGSQAVAGTREVTGGPVAPEALGQLDRLLFHFRGQLPRLVMEAGIQANPMEIKALLHIAHHPGCTASDLIRHSGRDKAQVARLIQQLEARGWVVRETSQADRRVQHIRITAAAEDVQRRLRQVRDTWATQLLERLSPQEQQVLAGLLAKLNG